MFYSRQLKTKLLRCIASSPIVLLTGGRQTGKTTMMKEISSELGFQFISLDNLRFLNSAREDPIGFQGDCMINYLTPSNLNL